MGKGMATVVYNSQAGSTANAPLDEVLAKLAALGYSPIHTFSKEEKGDLDRVLEEARDLVVTIGGDGTLRGVALRLIGRQDVQLACVPAGTANNVGKTLEVPLDWKEFLDGLADPVERSLDIGRIRGPLGEDFFVEAFGCGVFADMLALYDTEKGKSVGRAMSVVTDLLPNVEPYDLRLNLDGNDLSGQYVMLEAMNMAMTGPNLRLSPDADPFDGLLDIVLVKPDEKVNLFEYMKRNQDGNLEELQNVQRLQGKRLELVWTGFPTHIDDEARVDIDTPVDDERVRNVSSELKDEQSSVVVIDILPGAIRMLLPRTARTAGQGA
jgi:diacylglycerol kinase family enzyme